MKRGDMVKDTLIDSLWIAAGAWCFFSIFLNETSFLAYLGTILTDYFDFFRTEEKKWNGMKLMEYFFLPMIFAFLLIQKNVWLNYEMSRTLLMTMPIFAILFLVMLKIVFTIKTSVEQNKGFSSREYNNVTTLIKFMTKAIYFEVLLCILVAIFCFSISILENSNGISSFVTVYLALIILVHLLNIVRCFSALNKFLSTMPVKP